MIEPFASVFKSVLVSDVIAKADEVAFVTVVSPVTVKFPATVDDACETKPLLSNTVIVEVGCKKPPAISQLLKPGAT